MNQDIPLNNVLQAKKKNSKAIKIILAALSVIIILGLGGYGVYAWMQTSNLKKSLSEKEAENKTLITQNESLRNKPDNTTPDITETLPNGKTATYPNNEGNRNMLFWSAGYENNDKNFILLSHKDIQRFLSGVNPNTINNVCGTDGDLKALKYNISIAILNTDTKVLTSPQNGDCVDMLASDENSDTVLRTKARTVIDTVNKDMKAFIQSVTIK